MLQDWSFSTLMREGGLVSWGLKEEEGVAGGQPSSGGGGGTISHNMQMGCLQDEEGGYCMSKSWDPKEYSR